MPTKNISKIICVIGLSYEEGSAVGVPYFTAYRALKSIGKAHKGEKLLIHGASGGVGTAAIQIAKFLGSIYFLIHLILYIL